MRFLRTVHNRGSLTLPSDIRDVLQIAEGDVVEFEVLRVVRKAQPTANSPSPPSSAPSPDPAPAAAPSTPTA